VSNAKTVYYPDVRMRDEILDSNIVIYAFDQKYRESSLESFLLEGELNHEF
jgi:predicted nucleic acid-binding protein